MKCDPFLREDDHEAIPFIELFRGPGTPDGIRIIRPDTCGGGTGPGGTGREGSRSHGGPQPDGYGAARPADLRAPPRHDLRGGADHRPEDSAWRSRRL